MFDGTRTVVVEYSSPRSNPSVWQFKDIKVDDEVKRIVKMSALLPPKLSAEQLWQIPTLHTARIINALNRSLARYHLNCNSLQEEFLVQRRGTKVYRAVVGISRRPTKYESGTGRKK